MFTALLIAGILAAIALISVVMWSALKDAEDDY